MSETTEIDVVEMLRAEKIDVPIPGLPFCTERITRPICEQAASLIERLQRELKETNDKLNIAILDGAAAAWDRDTIRQQTREECATIADILECRHVGREIRALNSNGGGKP